MTKQDADAFADMVSRNTGFDPRTKKWADDDLHRRIKRLEDIAVLLAQEASRGQGAMGRPFWDFVDAIREERA